jgi:transcriptional regulator GlxA family with amidase domain
MTDRPDQPDNDPYTGPDIGPGTGDASRRGFLLSAGVTLAGASIGVLPVAAAATPLPAKRKTLGMVVFDGFQLLDVFGPLEMFGALRDRIEIVMIAERSGSMKSSAGPSVIADYSFSTAPPLDIVMIPGGMGTRREVNNPAFVSAFKAMAEVTPHVATICTGSAVLARTGLLDGVRATTNKHAYAWATSQGAKVVWVPEARWVEDGKYFTSSGISAGMDMALGLIERLYGRGTAEQIANNAEYHWNSNPDEDPYARMNGLTG